MKRIALALLLAACTPPQDLGGWYFDYIEDVQTADFLGETMEVRGICNSGCVLKLAAHKVCVHENATLGVHEARIGRVGVPYSQSTRSEEGTKEYRSMLPSCASKLFDEKGGFSSGTLVTVKGWEILNACKHIKPCP